MKGANGKVHANIGILPGNKEINGWKWRFFCYARCVYIIWGFGVRWTWHWLTEIQLAHTEGANFPCSWYYLCIEIPTWNFYIKKHHVVCWKRGERGPSLRGETAPVHNVQNLPLKTVACRGRPMRTHHTLYAHFALHSQILKQRVLDRGRGVRDLREGRRLFEALPHTAPPFFSVDLQKIIW